MTDDVRDLSRRRVRADLLTTTLGVGGLIWFVVETERAALFIGAYGLLLGTGTAVTTYCLTKFTGIAIQSSDRKDDESEADAGRLRRWWRIFSGAALESDDDIEEDTGWLIGRLENVLVVTLVVVGEYTALSIIFAAKSWVRREDTTSENTTYYLAGTLVNFTYSIAVGMGLVWALDAV